MKFNFLVSALALFFPAIIFAQDGTILEPDNKISRTDKRQQVDTYQVTLSAGQFIRVLVEQNELDVPSFTCPLHLLHEVERNIRRNPLNENEDGFIISLFRWSYLF